MDDITKKKLEAGAQMGWGAARTASGVATALGLGLLGGFLRSHNHMLAARAIGKSSIESGVKTFNEGLENWKRVK